MRGRGHAHAGHTTAKVRRACLSYACMHAFVRLRNASVYLDTGSARALLCVCVCARECACLRVIVCVLSSCVCVCVCVCVSWRRHTEVEALGSLKRLTELHLDGWVCEVRSHTHSHTRYLARSQSPATLSMRIRITHSLTFCHAIPWVFVLPRLCAAYRKCSQPGISIAPCTAN